MKKIQVDRKVVFIVNTIESMPDKVQKQLKEFGEEGKKLETKLSETKDNESRSKINKKIAGLNIIANKLIENNGNKEANLLDFIIVIINATNYFHNKPFTEQIEGMKLADKIVLAGKEKKDLILSEDEYKKVIELLDAAGEKSKIQTPMGIQEGPTFWEKFNWNPIGKPFRNYLEAINTPEEYKE